jgi:hypothetical protein
MQAAQRVAEAVKTGAYKKTKQFAGTLFGNIEEKQCCPAGSECCP